MVKQKLSHIFLTSMDVLNGKYNFSLKEEIKKSKTKKKHTHSKEGEKAKNFMSHLPIISHNAKKQAKRAEDNYIKGLKYIS